MLSPNTRLDDLTQEQMQDIGLSATGSSRLGTAGNPVVIPRIRSTTNLRLRWGEWLRIAITSVLAAAVAIEAVFFVMSAIWFGDLRHALLPFGPLALTLFSAALVMHIPETAPALRRAEPVVFVVGIIITALVLIRLFAVAGSALDDLSWLAAFAHIVDLSAEQPHTILGMIGIGISVIGWIMGVRLARLGGNYEKRRAAFIGFLALMMGAAGMGLILASDGRSDLSGTLAIMLPLYMFLGLMTLGQVRLTEVLRRAMSASANQRQITLWRLTTVLLSLFAILFVVLAGLIFYTRSYTQGLNLLLTIAGVIFFFLVTIIFWILSPLLNILGVGGNASSPAANCTPTPVGADSTVPTATPTVTGSSTIVSCVKTIHIPAGGGYVHISPQLVYIIIALLIITAGCLLAYLFLRRTANSETGDAYEEIQESLTIRGHEGQPRGAVLAPALDTPAAGTVRAAYRDFLQSSAAGGLARQTTETAAEFERRVTVTMLTATTAQPAPATAVDHLTAAYQDERYGAVAATPGRFAQAQALAHMLAGIFAPPRTRLARRNRAPTPMTENSAMAKREPFIQRWGLQSIGSLILLGLDGAYLRFVGDYRPLNAHGIIAGLFIFGVGVLTIALPISAVTLAFMTLNLTTTRYTIATKGIAGITLFLSIIILVPSAFIGVSILIKAISLIF